MELGDVRTGGIRNSPSKSTPYSVWGLGVHIGIGMPLQEPPLRTEISHVVLGDNLVQLSDKPETRKNLLPSSVEKDGRGILVHASTLLR